MNCPGCFLQCMLMISKYRKWVNGCTQPYRYSCMREENYKGGGVVAYVFLAVVVPMRLLTDTSVRETGINCSYDWDIVKDRKEG